ncbi:PREDICTED: longitudinals lacking protein, isoform G-like [Vollenhovia emeryi]|uniref:longitudinals lacking protein, isoform G-like n=1 Tax=Vollenhovia emeryi TaxID=411798 RepID=UPI0005F4FF57|nr:PREDICTED: longitudinals lacking protein, isoform G-like [Vollenhovia emeryi]
MEEIDPLALPSQQNKSDCRTIEDQITVQVNSTKVYPCVRCGRCYKVKRSLRRHIVVECGKAPKHKCPYCQHQSKYRASITKHVTNVHPNLPYPLPDD